jgi:hypothetical protein
MKEGCKAKAKATAKAKAKSKKQSGLLFFGLGVFSFGLAYLFLCPSVATLSFSLLSGKAANTDRSQRMLCPRPCWW